MTIPESLDNAVLALAPAYLVGATVPVEGANVGVSLVIYDLVIDGKGAAVRIDPPLAGTTNPGDVIELRLVGDTAFLDSKIIEDENAATTLRIPKDRLYRDRLNELYYIILRGSGNIGTSPILTVLYNKIRPGFKDIKPEIDGHSELALLLPDVIKNGVGPDFVSAQICVSYPYSRAYDQISLKCNGELLTYQVSKNEAPQPPSEGSPVPNTVCFTVTRAYLERARRPSQTFDFAYTVTDQLGNTPDPDAIWSASQRVDEDLAGTQFQKAILREIQNDPDDDPDTIELEKLGINPLLLIFLTIDARIQPGDRIDATYIAKLENQQEIKVPVSGVVEADEFGQKKPCILQIANDKVIARSIVTVTYQVNRGDALIGISRPATSRVTGEGQSAFKAPQIAEADANGNSLQPINAINTLTASIPAEGLLFTDWISVTWRAPAGTPAGGSYTTVSKPLSETGLNIALLVSVLAFNLGKTPIVTYTITRGGTSITSLPLNLNVGFLPASSFNSPEILEASGNDLDVPALGGKDATIHALIWHLIAIGQQVWMSLEGQKADGTAHNLIIWNGGVNAVTDVWLSQGYREQSVPNSYLSELGDGTSLVIRFSAALDQSNLLQNAVVFAAQQYTIRKLSNTVPEYEGFATAPLGGIPFGGTIEVPTMKVTAASSGISISSYVINPHISGNCIHSYGGKINFFLLKPANSVRFGLLLYSHPPADQLIVYLDKNGVEIGRESQDLTGGHWIDYSAPSGKQIQIIIVEIYSTRFMIDNFTLNPLDISTEEAQDIKSEFIGHETPEYRSQDSI